MIITVMVFLCNTLHIPRATAVLVCYGPPIWMMVGICVWSNTWPIGDENGIRRTFTEEEVITDPWPSSNWVTMPDNADEGEMPGPVPQGPHLQILMVGGGGGGDRGSYFIPKKITTSEFVYPKKSLLFLAYPKEPLSRSFFCNPK